LDVRNTVKGELSGDRYYCRAYVFDHENRRLERHRPIIRRTIKAGTMAGANTRSPMPIGNNRLKEGLPRVGVTVFAGHCPKENGQI
jgi:hypothetical protein